MSKKIRKGDFIGNRYEILKIFKGSMGIVYISHDHERNEIIALKTFQERYIKTKSIIDSFKREALAWIQLERHTFIVQAKYIIKIDDRLFIALDYITPNSKGRNTLTHYLKDSISLQQTLKWSIQFSYGMEHSESKGVSPHRDIKPDNIMITLEGNVKITDFGIAKLWDRQLILPEWSDFNQNDPNGLTFLKVTAKGEIIAGTLPYMAPEQFEGKSDVRSDIYSFGIVLYQLVNGGKLPIVCEYEADYKHAHMTKKIPKVDSKLYPVIERCLQKKAGDRYKNFNDLRTDLELLYKEEYGEMPDFSPKEKELEDWEYYNKGLSFYTLGLQNEAIQAFKDQLNLCPGYEECYHWHYDMGRVLKYKGLINDAIIQFKNALKLNPDLFDVRNSLGKALEDNGSLDEAIQEYKKLIQIQPNNSIGHINLGKAYELLGDFDNAILTYKNFIKIAPKQESKNIKLVERELKTLKKKASIKTLN